MTDIQPTSEVEEMSVSMSLDWMSFDTSDSDDTGNDVFYAVAVGKELSDQGIYRSWAEIDHRVTFVSGAVNTKFTNRKDAEMFIEKHNGLAGATYPRRKSQRNKEKPDYITLSGKRPGQTSKTTETKRLCSPEIPDQPRQIEREHQDESDDTHTGANPMDIDEEDMKKQRDDVLMQALNARQEAEEMKKEMEAIKHQLEVTKKKNSDLEKQITAYRNGIVAAKTANTHLKEDLEEQNLIQSQLETTLLLTLEEKAELMKKLEETTKKTPRHTKTLSIGDSNQHSIIKTLQEKLKPITTTTNIHTASQLLEQIKENNITQPDLTIIMQGTNDTREGRLATSIPNIPNKSQQPWIKKQLYLSTSPQ